MGPNPGPGCDWAEEGRTGGSCGSRAQHWKTSLAAYSVSNRFSRESLYFLFVSQITHCHHLLLLLITVSFTFWLTKEEVTFFLCLYYKSLKISKSCYPWRQEHSRDLQMTATKLSVGCFHQALWGETGTCSRLTVKLALEPVLLTCTAVFLLLPCSHLAPHDTTPSWSQLPHSSPVPGNLAQNHKLAWSVCSSQECERATWKEFSSSNWELNLEESTSWILCLCSLKGWGSRNQKPAGW